MFLIQYYVSTPFAGKYKKFKLKEKLEEFAGQKVSEGYTIEIYRLVNKTEGQKSQDLSK